jgi:hypothetical protein
MGVTYERPRSALLLALIHPSAWKECSRKLGAKRRAGTPPY